jgi:hypothetical protein
MKREALALAMLALAAILGVEGARIIAGDRALLELVRSR